MSLSSNTKVQVVDSFGIKQIYKTKQNEISWVLNDTASNPDLTIHDLNSKVTKQTDRGFPYFTASVNTSGFRTGIDIPSFKFEIRPSGELFGNQKYNFQTGAVENGYLYTANDIGDAEVTFVARRRTVRGDHYCQFDCRGGDHDINSTANVSNISIRYPTTSLGAGSLSNEIFQKELIDGIVDTINAQVKVNTAGWPADTWMAFKVVTYTMTEDKSQVMNRLFYDNDPIDFTQSPPRYRNNWVLVSEYIDKFAAETGNYNTIVNWRGCMWTVRIDNTDFIDFTGVSLRSIDPILNEDAPPGATGGSGGLGGGDTTGIIDPSAYVGGSLNLAVTGQVDTNIILAPPLSDDFIDNGGPLINKVDVWWIFWGSEWTTQTTPYSKAQLDTAIQTIFGSTYYDSLIQYRKVKRPINRGSVINSTFAKIDQYNEVDAKNLIDNCKALGLIPSTVASTVTLFMIITPNAFYRQSAGIRGWTFNTSGYNFGFVDFQSTIALQTTLMLGVVADFMVNNNPAGPGRAFITNPSGTFDTTPNATITDVCNTSTTVSGVTVPRYWSNQANACVAPTANPTFVSCNIGATWDPTNQVCNVDSGVTPTPTPTPTPIPIVYTPSILATPQGAEVLDKGGYVALPNLNVYLIFWGSYWNSGTPLTTKNNIIASMNAIFTSKYFDHIYQYRRTKRPQIKDMVTNITYTTVNNYTATNATALINDCKTQNLIPTNFDVTNSFFIIMNPTSIVKSGSTSGAFDHYKDTYYWAFMNVQSTLNLYTESLSNLIVNTATDTDPLQGFVLKSNTRFPSKTAGVDELTEICSTIADVVGVSVRRYWSDQENVCVAKDLAPTWISCSPGSTWNPTIQECVLDVQPTPTPLPGGGDQGSGSAIGGVDTSSPGKYSNSIIASPKTRIIKYNGGVIPNPLQFAFIFWGSEWLTPETQSGLTRDQIMIAVDIIFRSNYFDFLYQYRKIKRPQLLGSVVNTTYPTKVNYKHSDVVGLVKDSIDTQLVPFNTSTVPMSNTIAHFVISPTGTFFSGPMSSTGSFLAAGHGWEEVNTGVTTPYHILGWCIPAIKEIGYNLTDQTEWISKMLLGMVTDPKPFTGIVTSIVGPSSPGSVTPTPLPGLFTGPVSSSMAFTRNTTRRLTESSRGFKSGYYSLENNKIMAATNDDNNSKKDPNYDSDGEYIGPFIKGKKRAHPFKGITDFSFLNDENFNIIPDFKDMASRVNDMRSLSGDDKKRKEDLLKLRTNKTIPSQQNTEEENKDKT